MNSIFGFYPIHLELSRTTVTKRLRKHPRLYRKKCPETHEVKIFMQAHLFLSLIVDIVIKVIADRYFSILQIWRAQYKPICNIQKKYKSKDNIAMYIYKISLIVDIVIKVIADSTPINSRY